MPSEVRELLPNVTVDFTEEQHRGPAHLPVRITPVADQGAPVPPETVAVITAAVVAYLDHEFAPPRTRVESRVTSAWLQYGRVLMQRSHNLPRSVARVA